MVRNVQRTRSLQALLMDLRLLLLREAIQLLTQALNILLLAVQLPRLLLVLDLIQNYHPLQLPCLPPPACQRLLPQPQLHLTPTVAMPVVCLLLAASTVQAPVIQTGDLEWPFVTWSRTVLDEAAPTLILP
jgi:hypothetical protein